MKTILKTIACSLLIAGTVNAQSITDEAKTTTVKEYEINNEKTITVKTTSVERRNLMLDPKDAGELNQSLVDSPIYVEKSIMIDYDNDDRFDREVHLTYQKRMEDDLNYVATPNGIYISSSDSTPLFITEPGAYELDSRDIENIKILVKNINTTKQYKRYYLFKSFCKSVIAPKLQIIIYNLKLWFFISEDTLITEI